MRRWVSALAAVAMLAPGAACAADAYRAPRTA